MYRLSIFVTMRNNLDKKSCELLEIAVVVNTIVDFVIYGQKLNIICQD